ncbi:hypothetical protein EXU34_22085 [Alteromonas sp. ZYF713]|nr:hypothetical protein [Alteromonas sp. ZYF713]
MTAQIAKLKTFLIIPEKARVTSASFKQYDFERYKIGKVWAIAKAENNWLLTLDGEQEFALAFGNDINNLEMLGFSSSDALAEWLG